MEKRQSGEYTTYDTRGDSYELVDKQKRYKQILEILGEHDEGLTAKETAVYMMRKKYIPTSERNFAAPRLSELMDMGIVESIGKKICKYTHKRVAVYAIRR